MRAIQIHLTRPQQTRRALYGLDNRDHHLGRESSKQGRCSAYVAGVCMRAAGGMRRLASLNALRL